MIYAPCARMHMCSGLLLSHTLSLLPLPFLSVFTSRLLFLHMLISHLFLLSRAPDQKVHNTRCLRKLSRRKSRLHDMKMKAKMVFDSPRAAAQANKGMENWNMKKCVRMPFLNGKANNFTSDCSIYGYIQYRGDPSVLATRYHTACNNGKLFSVALRNGACAALYNKSHFLFCN